MDEFLICPWAGIGTVSGNALIVLFFISFVLIIIFSNML